MDYIEFLSRKQILSQNSGFEPKALNPQLYDFQTAIVRWALQKGRAAIFADCGLGKTPMQLEWANRIVEKTNKRVLILTPLAVSHQTVFEGKKFGIECHRIHEGELYPGINIINYERLHFLDSKDFVGCVCDESSILKNFDGKRKSQITQFMKKMPYRLLCTATAAPNDYIELGTSSEALGELGFMDMLNRFFKNDNNTSARNRYMGEIVKWRFKGHAEKHFWKWVSSWAKTLRKPSDLGFDNDVFVLPDLIENQYTVEAKTLPDGMLFALPAIGLKEQREERRRTIQERCERVAEMVNNTTKPALVWCHLNKEGDLLERLIPDSIQVSGSDSEDKKEERLIGFAQGKFRVLVTKPKIGAWGLNFQHCSHVTFFPSHSYEQYYQGVRRCWRFGQVNPVTVDIITTEGEQDVMKNIKRKSDAADKMFSSLVKYMNEVTKINKVTQFKTKEAIPSWLLSTNVSANNMHSITATVSR